MMRCHVVKGGDFEVNVANDGYVAHHTSICSCNAIVPLPRTNHFVHSEINYTCLSPKLPSSYCDKFHYITGIFIT